MHSIVGDNAVCMPTGFVFTESEPQHSLVKLELIHRFYANINTDWQLHQKNKPKRLKRYYTNLANN